MRYLVTGATGLLGNNVVRQLVEARECVRVLARTTSDPRAIEGLPVEQAAGDVRDQVAVAAACCDVDVVIHCAGHVHIGWTQLDEHLRINVFGTQNVAAAARGTGARLVHVSSINALGLGRIDQPADEETALPGIVECPYVVTKREAERVVLREVEKGLWATIVNPSLMLGPWDWKPSSGKMFLAARFAPLAPTGASNFCDVRDVAAGVIAAASRGAAGRRFILGGHNFTYWQAWKQMAKVAGKRGPFLPMGPLFRGAVGPVLDAHRWITRREGDANSAALAMGRQQHCFSSRRAEQELGYQVRPFAETLADTWAWFRQWGYA